MRSMSRTGSSIRMRSWLPSRRSLSTDHRPSACGNSIQIKGNSSSPMLMFSRFTVVTIEGVVHGLTPSLVSIPSAHLGGWCPSLSSKTKHSSFFNTLSIFCFVPMIITCLCVDKIDGILLVVLLRSSSSCWLPYSTLKLPPSSFLAKW